MIKAKSAAALPSKLRGTRQSGSGARTILLLQVIAASGGEFTLSELAQRAEMPPSSMHRVLQPLLKSGLVTRAPANGYRTGDEFYHLAAAVLQQINQEVTATPFLRPLWDKWQETVVFCLYRPAERIGIATEIIPSPHPLRHVIEPYATIVLSWGSLGRAILAYLDPADVSRVRSQAPKGPITGAGVPKLKDLRAELAHIRQCGVAVYRNDVADLAGVAAPVFRSNGVVIGSIGVTLPCQRYERMNGRELAVDVAKAAAAMGKRLGHRAR